MEDNKNRTSKFYVKSFIFYGKYPRNGQTWKDCRRYCKNPKHEGITHIILYQEGKEAILHQTSH